MTAPTAPTTKPAAQYDVDYDVDVDMSDIIDQDPELLADLESMALTQELAWDDIQSVGNQIADLALLVDMGEENAGVAALQMLKAMEDLLSVYGK